eukprot:6831134-Ditylum_brightwellii.AAC.1
MTHKVDHVAFNSREPRDNIINSSPSDRADDISVMSSSMLSYSHSVYTRSTVGSSLTQSTRKRRPGAAQRRMAKAKEAEQASAGKGKGWFDSMRVVAETSQRRWDPKVGWVDYQEPDTDNLTPEDVVITPIGKLSLAGSINRRNREEDGSYKEVDAVP